LSEVNWDALLREEMDWAIAQKKTQDPKHEDEFRMRCRVVGPNGEWALLPLAWRNEEEKHRSMSALSNTCKAARAQAAMICSDVRILDTLAFCKHFKDCRAEGESGLCVLRSRAAPDHEGVRLLHGEPAARTLPREINGGDQRAHGDPDGSRPLPGGQWGVRLRRDDQSFRWIANQYVAEMVGLMTQRIKNVVFIAPEEDRVCELCGKEAECRPAGPKQEQVCYECGVKDEAAMKRYTQRLFQGGLTQ